MALSPGSVERAAYGGKEYEIPRLSATGTTFEPVGDNVFAQEILPKCCAARALNKDSENAGLACECSPFWDDLCTVWDSRKLGARRRVPLALSSPVDDPAWRRCFRWGATDGMFWPNLAPKPIRVLDMPVKFPGSHQYRVPRECERILPVLRYVAEVERAINPRAKECYAFLTIDQGTVLPDETQRQAGLHVDGFQGARVEPKLMLGHSYIVGSCVPTVCHRRTFPGVASLDPKSENLFGHMELALADSDEVHDTWSPEPFQVCLLDAYCVHSGAPNRTKKPVDRTFIRISFSVRQFDRLGNAHNPMFDYAWEMVPRDISIALNDPRGSARAKL
jgi:hypothetical protein